MPAAARRLVWSLAVYLGWWPLAAVAAPPAAEHLAKLITDLGSEEFTLRESATEELTRIGLPAFAALEAAATHPDREVRYRSQRILGLIREHDLKRRLEAFLSGKELDGEYPLPGWTRFKKSYGDDAQGRAMYVEMLRADAELLRAVDDNPRVAADVVSQRAGQLQDWARLGVQQQLSLGQITAALFAAAEEDVTLQATSTALLLNQCFQQSFRDALNSNDKGPLTRKLVGAVIRRAEDTAAYTAMQVAQQLDLPDGIVPALKILDGKMPVVRSPSMVTSALATVARMGDKAHLPQVEKLLTDNSRVGTSRQQNGVTIDLQVRDAALATAILLHKRELKDFFNLQGKALPSDTRSILSNASLIGFANESEREAVFKKWEAFTAK